MILRCKNQNGMTLSKYEFVTIVFKPFEDLLTFSRFWGYRDELTRFECFEGVASSLDL